MEQPIEDGGGDHGVAEDVAQRAEALVGREPRCKFIPRRAVAETTVKDPVATRRSQGLTPNSSMTGSLDVR